MTKKKIDKFWYQLTKWMPEKYLKSFIENFEKHKEMHHMRIKTTPRGSAIFTDGRFQLKKII